MFSAVRHNKAGHWFTDADQPTFSWRASVRREDTLTAFFFDTLCCLSGTTIAKLLSSAVSPKTEFSWLAPGDFELNYWPRLGPGGSVEPDVVLTSESLEFLLGVESKLDGLQHEGQIEQEIAALRETYPESHLFFMAVGGENNESVTSDLINRLQSSEVTICGMTWRGAADAVKFHIQTAQSDGEKRCLGLLLEGLMWFGINPTSERFAFPFPPIDWSSLINAISGASGTTALQAAVAKIDFPNLENGLKSWRRRQ